MAPTAIRATAGQGTVVAQIDGDIEIHPWVDVSQVDGYSEFNTESEMMGCSSTSDHGHPSRYLWGMNEAWFRFQPELDEGPPIYPPGEMPLAMAMVSVDEPHRPPVEPLLRCLSASLARCGSVINGRVSVAVEVTVPSPDPEYGFAFANGHRFTHRNPKEARTCRVDVASSKPADLEVLAMWDLRPMPFRFRTTQCEPDPVEFPAWLHASPMLVSASILVDVPEWSVDAAAWVISMTAAAGVFATDAVVSVTPVS